MAFGLPRVPLRGFAETERFFYMDRLEQYLRNKQDDDKRYDWEGNVRGFGASSSDVVRAGWMPSLSSRKPSTRYNLPRIIVSNLTQMALGGTSFPEINVDGDETAQQSLREWSKLMKLPSRLAEARNFGGAEGTAVTSLGISRGRFRVDVHNPKHVTVLDWENPDEFVPRRVVKTYSFERDVYDAEAGKFVTRTFWYVRYWDAQLEAVWNQIPDATAKLAEWQELVPPDFVSEHNFGFTPVYWVQNLPDSQEVDGEGDYEGIEDKIDEINRLYSATTKGAIKNVDPTLVIKEEDDEEQAPIQKGSGAVIHAPNGAEYLELKGTAIEAARELINDLRQTVLEEAQVVIPREDKITGAAQSAAAMRILYRPMIARCNTLRDQYGPLIERMLSDVLRIARHIRGLPPYEEQLPDGSVTTRRPVVVPDLAPGEKETVTLRWPEYFAPTSQDVKDTTTTAQGAAGGKPVISHRTAVDYVSRLFGVTDVDEELAAIEEEAEVEADRAGEQLEREAEITARLANKGAPAPDADAPDAE